MKLNRIGFLITEGLKNIVTYGFMSFASVTIILACLVIMGSFGLLSININEIIEKLEKETEVVAFIDESLTEKIAQDVQPLLEAVPNVEKVEFISAEEAYKRFADQIEGKQSFAGLDSDTMRHRYVVHLIDISQTRTTIAELEKVEGVAEVSAHLDIVNGFITVRNIVNAVTMILAVILFIVSIFIMSNTIKLATFGRREEIAIMKMVGANNAFIRFPFVIEGMILGILGAGLAYLAEWGVYTLVCERVMSGIAGRLVTVVPFETLMLPLIGAYFGIGLFVGVFGSLIAIRNYLKV